MMTAFIMVVFFAQQAIAIKFLLITIQAHIVTRQHIICAF